MSLFYLTTRLITDHSSDQFSSDGQPRETYLRALEERRVRLQTINEEDPESWRPSGEPKEGPSSASSVRAGKKSGDRKESDSGVIGILDSLMSTGDGSAKSNKLVWFISFIWFCSCIIGLIHQVITISDGYFRYSVTTETAIQVATKVRPPALSICFIVVDVRIWSEFPEDSPCYKRTLVGQGLDKDHGSCLNDFLNLSMRSVKKRTFEFDDLIEQIWYREPSTYEEVFLNKSSDDGGFDSYVDKHVSTVIKGDMLCYRIRPLVNFSSDEYNSFVINDNKHQGAIMSLYFNLTAMRDAELARIYMHLPSTYPRGYLIPPLIYNVTETERFVASYSKIVNNFLPPPFASRCHDYALSSGGKKFKNQKECVELCLDNSTSDPGNFVYPTTVKCDFGHKKLDLEMRDVLVRVSCFQHCPINCRDVSFYPRKMTRVTRPTSNPLPAQSVMVSTSPAMDSVLSLASSEPEITVTFNARTELFEYVIYIASCFSLWFGGAVYSSTLSILFMSTSLLQKYLGIKKQIQEERRKSLAHLDMNGVSPEGQRRSEWILHRDNRVSPGVEPWYKNRGNQIRNGGNQIRNFLEKGYQTLKRKTKNLILG